MPTTYTINPKQSIELDRSVDTVTVDLGTALVSYPGFEDEPIFLSAEGVRELGIAGGAAPVTIYAPDSATVTVTFTEEAAPSAPASRGDTGGSGGGLEARTRTELRFEAKKKGITGSWKMNKNELVAALRKS